MKPILFETDLLGVHVVAGSYRVFLVLAAFSAIALLVWVAHRRGLPARRVAVFALLTAAAIPVGARLLHAATNASLYAENPALLWQLSFTNYALYGGLTLAAVVGVVAARALSLDLWRVADAAAPALGAGIVLARTGCFLNGCCFGEACDASWAVTFPPMSNAHLWQIAQGQVDLFGAPLPVYPTQLLELAGALVATIVALVLMQRRVPDGVAFLTFVALFTATRWAVRPLRVIPASFGAPGWLYSALYATIIVVCIGLMLYRVRARQPHASATITDTSGTPD